MELKLAHHGMFCEYERMYVNKSEKKKNCCAILAMNENNIFI